MLLILLEEERRKQAWADTGCSFQRKTSPPNLCSLRLEIHLYFKNMNQVKPFDSFGWQNLSRATAEEEALSYSSLDESRRQNKEFTHRSHFLWKQVDHRDVERFVLIVLDKSVTHVYPPPKASRNTSQWAAFALISAFFCGHWKMLHRDTDKVADVSTDRCFLKPSRHAQNEIPATERSFF